MEQEVETEALRNVREQKSRIPGLLNGIKVDGVIDTQLASNLDQPGHKKEDHVRRPEKRRDLKRTTPRLPRSSLIQDLRVVPEGKCTTVKLNPKLSTKSAFSFI